MVIMTAIAKVLIVIATVEDMDIVQAVVLDS